MTEVPPPRPWKTRLVYFGTILVVALLTAGVMALLMNIAQRKQEGREHFFARVPLDEDSPATVWRQNFPSQYDGYIRTVDTVRTRHGGSEAIDRLLGDTRLKRFYAGYAFSEDFREDRGHAYMLQDQDETRRVKIVNQPGSCLHCHSSVIPAYREAGKGDVMAGFKTVCAESWDVARKRVAHPVSCVDCHDPKTTQLRVTRPGFLIGIQELAHFLADTRKKMEDGKKQFARLTDAEKKGKEDAGLGYREMFPHLPSLEQYAKANAALARDKNRPAYDVNAQATRQEMRSFVCGQCHVEYYFNKDEKNLLVYPWARGLKVEQIEDYYENFQMAGATFKDWKHKETEAPMLKAQHPEFEMWNQGIHARSGVACADCHMPYKREGAIKISDHHVRSPLLNIARACQTCHRYDEKEILARAEAVQERTAKLMDRAENAVVDLIEAIKLGKTQKVADDNLAQARQKHRQAQWRLDFVMSENSMGFHAPQECARILGEAIDLARQGQLEVWGKLKPVSE